MAWLNFNYHLQDLQRNSKLGDAEENEGSIEIESAQHASRPGIVYGKAQGPRARKYKNVNKAEASRLWPKSNRAQEHTHPGPLQPLEPVPL